eukprot:1009493-Heterocapsa_arctica.AAC.1
MPQPPQAPGRSSSQVEAAVNQSLQLLRIQLFVRTNFNAPRYREGTTRIGGRVCGQQAASVTHRLQ